MIIGKSDHHILCELKNKQSIGEVITRNCQGLDRGDPDIFLSTYHEDALVETDEFRGTPGGYFDWVSSGMGNEILSSMHFVTNVFIEIDEMTHTIGACESYFLAVTRFARGGEIFDRIACGRCVDHFECRTINQRCRMGSWRISHRIVVPDWDRVEPAGDQSRDFQGRNNPPAQSMADKALQSFFKRTTIPLPAPRSHPLKNH